MTFDTHKFLSPTFWVTHFSFLENFNSNRLAFFNHCIKTQNLCQLSLYILYPELYWIKIWWVWWNVYKINLLLSNKILYNICMMNLCIVKNYNNLFFGIIFLLLTVRFEEILELWILLKFGSLTQISKSSPRWFWLFFSFSGSPSTKNPPPTFPRRHALSTNTLLIISPFLWRFFPR